jgi:hypothetical protein
MISLIDVFVTSVYILIIYFAFVNLELSVLIYVSSVILIPYLRFNLGGFSLSYNFLNVILLGSLFLNLRKKNVKFDYIIAKPFFTLFICLLFGIFFTTDFSILYQIKQWQSYSMQSCILPITIWNICKYNIDFKFKVRKIIFLSLLIACFYGLFLIYTSSYNFYTSAFSIILNQNNAAEVYRDSENILSFSKSSKIQSTMNHPMTWTIFLLFSFIYFHVINYFKKSFIYSFLLLLILLNVLFCGVRSGLSSFCLILFFYIVYKNNLKYYLLLILSIISFYYLIDINETVNKLYISLSTFSDTKSQISGSSISLRLSQLNGVFREINGSEFFGKGFGWTHNYYDLYGDHPSILAFESLLFVVLCNHGYVGLILWILFFVSLFILNFKLLVNNKHKVYLDLLLLIFISYTLFTGEYNYLQYLFLFYILTLLELNVGQCQK